MLKLEDLSRFSYVKTRLCHNPEQNFETGTAEQSHSRVCRMKDVPMPAKQNIILFFIVSQITLCQCLMPVKYKRQELQYQQVSVERSCWKPVQPVRAEQPEYLCCYVHLEAYQHSEKLYFLRACDDVVQGEVVFISGRKCCQQGLSQLCWRKNPCHHSEHHQWTVG